MDQTLADFMAQTGADSGLARDILAETNWNIASALKAYSTLTQLNSSGPAYSRWTNGESSSIHTTSICPDSPKRDSGGEKRLTRGFSAATENAGIISNVRHQVSRSINSDSDHHHNGISSAPPAINTTKTSKSHRNSGTSVDSFTSRNGGSINGSNGCHIETSTYTFTLPNLNDFDEDFRAFLEKDLIETASLKALEGSGHLNWWASGGMCQKLWPLATTGDGNCLLHAASLGMWGFHDRQLMLRKALHEILTKGSRRHALWRRWRWQQTQQNKEADLIYSEEEWRAEWNNIVRLASPQPRSKPNSAEPLNEADHTQTKSFYSHPSQSSTPLPNQIVDASDDGSDTVYESLEELHVFALAHVLKRPIIVIADTVLRDAGGEAFAPIPFGGIYLPLECSPAECHRAPLVLCYDAAHFSALVVMQGQQAGEKRMPALVPITDKEHRLLPLHFASDPGPDFTWWTDEEDAKIAAAATLNEKSRLDLVSRYVGLCKVPSKKPKSTSLNNGCLPSAPTSRFGSHDGSFVQNGNGDRSLAAVPRQVTGSTGALDSRRSSKSSNASPPAAKVVWSKLTRTIRKRLKSKTRTLTKEGKLFEKNGYHHISNGGEIPIRTNGRIRFVYEAITMADLSDTSIIVGAQLNTDSHPEFMQKMVENYLKSARDRFEVEKDKAPQPGRPIRRERISRSFSASNVFVRCMNGDCAGQASHQTNYLCEICFRKQKQLMESFTVAKSNGTTVQTDASTPNVPPAPPTFVVAAAPVANDYGNKPNRASSVPFNKYCTLPAIATSSTMAEVKPAMEPMAMSVARSTFYGAPGSFRRSIYGRSMSPVYTTARSKFYSMNGSDGMESNEDGTPKLTVVQPLMNGDTTVTSVPLITNGYSKYRSVETRYGVTAVTNPHGVTHYFIPSSTGSTGSSPSSNSTTFSAPPDCKMTDNLPVIGMI